MKDYNNFKSIYKKNLEDIIILNNNSGLHENITGHIIQSDGKEYIQNINIITKNSDDVLVTTWSAFENGGFTKKSVIDLVHDFEENHPDYIVEYATNADYFNYDGQSINANVIFDNRVLKSNNHQKYFSVEINPDGKIIETYKQTKVTKDRFITFISSNTKQVKKEDDLFTLVKAGNELLVDNNYYPIKIKYFNEIDNHFYLEGLIDLNEKNSEYLLSVSKTLNLDIDNNTMIKVQHQINDFDQNNIMVGVDTVLIKNNKRLELEEITGQNFEHNTEVHPRTGFGYDLNGNLKIITVDGRLDESYGVNLLEFSKIMHDNGFVEAYNFDGGGSTQLVVRTNDELKTINLPSEYPLRPVGNVLLFITKKAE